MMPLLETGEDSAWRDALLSLEVRYKKTSTAPVLKMISIPHHHGCSAYIQGLIASTRGSFLSEPFLLLFPSLGASIPFTSSTVPSLPRSLPTRSTLFNMHFSLAILSFLAASALALPANNPRSVLGDIGDGISDAASDVKSAASDVADGAKDVVGANCDIAKCAAALGPEAAGCGAAVAQGLADPITDVACVATALNNAANKPAACSQCSL
jgi:Fungal calcium binding protein